MSWSVGPCASTDLKRLGVDDRDAREGFLPSYKILKCKYKYISTTVSPTPSPTPFSDADGRLAAALHRLLIDEQVPIDLEKDRSSVSGDASWLFGQDPAFQNPEWARTLRNKDPSEHTPASAPFLPAIIMYVASAKRGGFR